VPQVAFELVWQVPGFPGPLEQQPLGQLAALQTHCWLTQACPLGHATQIAPLSPQLSLAVPGRHGPVAVSQQPSGQLVALQTHCPLSLQVSPAGQSPQLPPQPSDPQTLPAQFRVQQTPWASLQTQFVRSGQSVSLKQLPVHVVGTQSPSIHVSCGVQVSQSSPPVPQFWSVLPGWQVPGLPGPLEQHPFGQLCALQTHSWLTQACPAGQFTQMTPLSPQLLLAVPGRQGPAAVSQQPSGQLCGVQMHCPCALQTSPIGQPGGHCPPHPSGPHSRPWQFG
jgi:hypothetical protein